MAQIIAAQLKKLFSDSPNPVTTSEASPCFQLPAHRIVSQKKRTKDAPASLLVGTGFALAFDIDNQLNVFSLPDLAVDHGIRLAVGTDVIGADRQGEIMIKLVRDNDTDSALEAWNTLVDAIETKQYPVVAKGQMSTIPRTFFVGEQKPENQPQEVPQDEENAVPA